MTTNQPVLPVSRRNSGARLWLAAACGVLGVLCAGGPSQAQNAGPISPLPQTLPLDAGKVALGAQLFVDPRLSGNGQMSCVVCHQPQHGGADAVAFSQGIDGRPLDTNTTSIFNNEFIYLRNWVGNVESLASRIERVVRDPRLMNGEWAAIVPRLAGDAAVAPGFRTAYPDGVTQANIVDALTTYVRSLITPNARFDRALRGEAGAMTAEETEGYALFRRYGCVSCHQGQNMGTNFRQAFGVVGERGAYLAQSGTVRPADLGRFSATGQEADRFVFRVPSLRNVMLTAPYMHDGSVATAEQAVEVMFRYQLGLEPPKRDLELIVKFLGTLTGEQPGAPAGPARAP